MVGHGSENLEGLRELLVELKHSGDVATSRERGLEERKIRERQLRGSEGEEERRRGKREELGEVPVAIVWEHPDGDCCLLSG